MSVLVLTELSQFIISAVVASQCSCFVCSLSVLHAHLIGVLFCFFLCRIKMYSGEGVPDWPYYPVLAKFLEGRGDFGDSYDTGSHSYTEPEARPGASHHHPGS